MKRGNKTAQVTVFIVVAITIVVIVSGFIYFQGRNKEIFGEGEAGPINNFIQSCLDETLKEASEFVALQGGYYNNDVESIDYLNIKIPYYWLAEESKVPLLNTIETEISEYLTNNFDICLNNFKIFENSNYEIETSEIEINSLNVLENSIEAKVNLPTTIKIGDKVVEYKKFESEISSDLKKAYDFSKQIIEEQKKTPNEIPLSFILLLADNNGFTSEIINLEDDDVIYSLIFGEGSETEFIYAFIADYDWSEEEWRNQEDVTNETP